MASVEISINGLMVAIEALDRLATLNLVRQGLNAGADYLLSQLTVMSYYPPERHAPNPDLTPKQRRYLAYAVRAGLITIPYVRTGGLARGWEKTVEDGGLMITVGNATKASKYTHGPDRTRYHQLTGWQQEGAMWVRFGPETVRTVESVIGQFV